MVPRYHSTTCTICRRGSRSIQKAEAAHRRPTEERDIEEERTDDGHGFEARSRSGSGCRMVFQRVAKRFQWPVVSRCGSTSHSPARGAGQFVDQDGCRRRDVERLDMPGPAKVATPSQAVAALRPLPRCQGRSPPGGHRTTAGPAAHPGRASCQAPDSWSSTAGEPWEIR